MKKSKITPGPWEVVRSLTCGHLRAAHNYQEDPKQEWTDADIQAISCVPKMVEALIEANAYLADMAKRGGPKPGLDGVEDWSRVQNKISRALQDAGISIR